MISSFKVQKYLRNGGTAFLVSIAPVDLVLTPIEDLEVVREFPDVFPMELLGLPSVNTPNFHSYPVPIFHVSLHIIACIWHTISLHCMALHDITSHF